MKKLIITALFMGAFAFASFAQNNPTLTKEEKAAAKVKKEADLVAAFTELGLTANQQEEVRATLTDAEQKGKDIKNDDALNDTEKAAKKEEVNSAKNEKLKQIMGADKFKLWSAIRKRQKEGTPPPAAN